MTKKSIIKIATLNVKGLNNKIKSQETFTLLKSYKFDIIVIQETNSSERNLQNFLKQLWYYDSYWTSKAAILAGNKKIKLENI